LPNYGQHSRENERPGGRGGVAEYRCTRFYAIVKKTRRQFTIPAYEAGAFREAKAESFLRPTPLNEARLL
jgi:hypothetical protein